MDAELYWRLPYLKKYKNYLVDHNKYQGGFYMKVLSYIVLILSIIGCFNWGLVGFFNFNLINALFGTSSMISRAIYILVGLCGIYQLSFFFLLDDRR